MPGEPSQETRPAVRSGPEDEESAASSPSYRRLRPGPGLSREEVAAHQRSRLRRAMIELVATDGYEALTVRRLTKRARISSGTFYNHYRSTDDCLLSTFDLICRRAAERLVEAGRGEAGPRHRLTLAVDRLFRDMVANPQVATFMLKAAPAAGPAFTSRLRNSAMRLGVAVELCLRTGDGPSLPPPLVEGVVAGLARIGRTRLQRAAEDEIHAVAAETAEWIMSLCVPIEDLEVLAPPAPAARKTGSAKSRSHPSYKPREAPGDERAMILAAAFRIAKSGYHQLSVPRICREAGVARRDFNRHFNELEDCFSAMLEERVGRALATGLTQHPASGPWDVAVYEALAALCGAVEADVDGARVLFVEVSAAGTRGIDSCDRQISQVAHTLRTTAPEGQSSSELAAEASIAAAWAILRRRVSEQSPAATATPLLAFLLLTPTLGGPAALHAIEASRRRNRSR